MANILEVSGIVVFVMILIAPVPATSNPDTTIFSILNDSYIQNVYELPYFSGIPDKNIQQSGNIRGWIDITGFRNLTKKNVTYYVNANPSTLAILQYDAWGEFKCETCGYSIKKSVSVWDNSDNTTYANLFLKMVWYEKFYTKNGYSCVEHTEYAVFQDSEHSPLKIDNIYKDIDVIVRNRNFTVINSTEINIEIDDNTFDRYLIKTDDGFYEKINRIWHVEQTPKGVNYANETKVDIFKTQNISHRQNTVVVDDGNNTNFSVSASGFYYSNDKTNVTRLYEVSDPAEQFFCGDLIGFLIILICFFGFINIYRGN